VVFSRMLARSTWARLPSPHALFTVRCAPHCVRQASQRAMACEGGFIFFTVKTRFVLSQKEKFLSLPFCQSFSVEAPCILHALPGQTIIDYLPQQQDKICHFILDIMDISWLAKTSNKAIGPSTRGWR